MDITATFTNQIAEGLGKRYFFRYSGGHVDGKEESLLFDAGTTSEDVRTAVRDRVRQYQAAYDAASEPVLVGEVVSR